jgi:hypothetical protein
VAELSALERRCVVPFHRKMMGLNALRQDGLLGAVRDMARETTWSSWPCTGVRVSWVPGSHQDGPPRVEAALLGSLETAQGSLTAPPLAAVALHGLGRKAKGPLRTYLLLDLEQPLGIGRIRGCCTRTHGQRAVRRCHRRPGPCRCEG